MDPVLARILNELDRQHRDWQWFYTELGYTKQHVGGWKRRRVPPAEYEMIADVLGKTVDWVARGSEDESTARGATASLSDSTPFTVDLYSAKKSVRAPAVEWARLETDLKKGYESFDERDFFEFMKTKEHSANVKLVMIQDDSLGPRLQRGDFIAFDLDRLTPERDDVILVKSGLDQTYFIRRFSPLSGGHFNAVAPNGSHLRSDHDELQIIGVGCGLAVSRL